LLDLDPRQIEGRLDLAVSLAASPSEKDVALPETGPFTFEILGDTFDYNSWLA
jgi:hypothetical protein